MNARRRKASGTSSQTPAWFDAWNRLSPARRHVVSLGLLVAVGLVFMAPILFGSGRLVGGDTMHWAAMAESVLEAEEATGEKPLWAVRPFAGMPAYMISYDHAVPQLDDVGVLLRRIAWPFSHLAILFAGTYLLVFTLTRDRIAGVLGAVAFGLTTYLPELLIAGHNSKYIALAYLPWLLLAFVFAVRRPGLLAGLLFAAAVALNLRAGHVQISYYGAFVIGVWWIVEAISAVREGRGGEIARTTGWLIAGGVLGILMVADPYLVQAEYKRFTIRGAASGGAEGGLAWDYAMGWSQGVGELLTLLVADAFGGGGATYWGPKSFTAGPHYVGGVVLLLAVVALAKSHSRSVVALAVAGVLMTGFALGENLEPLNRFMFEYFPLFDAFRVPETWLSAVALVIAVLAGTGLRESVRRDPDPADDAARSRLVLGVSAGVLVVAAVLALWGDVFLSFEKPGEIETLAAQVAQQRPDLSLEDPQVIEVLRQEIARRKGARAERFDADARRTALFVLLAFALLFLARRRRLPGWLVAFGLVGLVAFDLGGVGRRYLNADALAPDRDVADLVPTYDYDRYLVDRRDEAGGDGTFRVLSLEGHPSVTARPAFHYESLGGYHGAKLRRYQDFLESILFDERGALSGNALRMANVEYVVSNRPMPGMEAVFVDDDRRMTVFRMDDPLPRAWFVDDVEAIPEPEAQWTRLGEASFDPARTAIVEEDLGLAAAPRDSASVLRVVQEAYAPEEIVWTVETDRPRLLVISETFYPAGWAARLDGEPVPIHATNYTWRGIVVPEGRHEVTLTFEPAVRRLALWLAGSATVLVYGGLLVLLGLAVRARPRQGTVASS